MSSDLTFILIATFGAAVQEIIHLYELRNKLDLPGFDTAFKSWKYWLITTLMIVVSGIGTWILYRKELHVESVIFILGAAFPMIFKKLVAGTVSPSTTQNKKSETNTVETKLGGFTFKDYFI